MELKLILPQDIFRYRALPREQWKHITALPKFVSLEQLPLSGFPQVDAQVEQQIRQTMNWDELPERNPSGSSFMDAFAALVHQFGFKRMDFYAAKLRATYPNASHIEATDLSRCLKVLTGISGPEWVIGYTLLMVHDLHRRTDLNKTQTVKALHFTNLSSFGQFMRNYDSKK
jgi:hypothetical protein